MMKTTHNMKTTTAIPVFQVSDVDASLKHYTGIFGFSEDFRFGDYAGIKLGDVRLLPPAVADLILARQAKNNE